MNWLRSMPASFLRLLCHLRTTENVEVPEKVEEDTKYTNVRHAPFTAPYLTSSSSASYP